VPSPELLRMFIDQGARRYVFEGRECGGHVGPLGSLVLWETQIRVLLQKIARADAGQVYVLFAGGIHDARSAAMVSAMAAPLAEHGVRVGVLMGSAYLFTQEIVSSGAIVPEFQAQAVACTRTVNVESGPGHATRCAATPFADEFYAERRRMLRDGVAGDEIREQLESLNLGRLRMASKGKRRDGDRIVDIDVATQVKDGMYMIGQVATLRDRLTTLADLHREVAEGSAALLEAAAPVTEPSTPPQPSDIAIVGIGTLLPKAPSPEAYWHNIVHKVNAITEVPVDRFDWRLYFDPERRQRDKIYSKWGGFLDEVAFDPTRFGIPPNSLRSIDPMQLLALEVVRRAIEDAGYADGDFDREQTSVIFGASGGLGDLGLQYAVRSEIPRIIEQTDERAWDRLPEWTEESFPGTLPNVAAGRVANRFDFGGLNFTVDAACASGLAAINLAVGELESGRASVAIAGGIDTVQSPFTYLCFAKTQALSPQGKAKTFDASGDGIVISEGLAAVVLKRLADAERDGDRIYAVIKAVAGSSDGKALGLTAPLPAGQMRALDRAYGKAGYSPRTLGMVEAHGTGTAVGDRAEIETVVRTLTAAETPARSCAVGSVKTIIGHTKATAGTAGLIKVALALHHRTLPPHVGVSKPLDPIAAADSPVYLLDEARPWFAHPDHPRRAGVSAFGFGGTNFHATLEEYRDEYRPAAARLSSAEWPCELFVFRAADKPALTKQLQSLRAALTAGAAPRLRDLAYSITRRAAGQSELPLVATAVAADLAQLGDGLDRLLVALGSDKPSALPPHLQLGEAGYRGAPIAFLFPGQGTQYPNMAREAALYLEPVRAALEQADRRLRDQLPRMLTQYIYPPAAFSEAETAALQARLTDTRIAQPAIGAVAAGFLDFVGDLGLRPAMTAGHSYGEFAALHAGGVLSRDDFLALSGARGRVMAEACNAPERGTMAAVRADRDKVEAGLAGIEDVIIANHNSPQQAVISGPEEAVKAAVARLKEQGLDARLLPVAGAFHSRLMAPVQAALGGAIAGATLRAGTAAVYSNTTGQPYPGEAEAVRRLLTDHLLKPVEFVRQIERMHADGARVFVELGPKSVLTGLVGQILGGRQHLAVALDGGGGLRGVLSALGTLVANGVALDLARPFEAREVQDLNLARLAELYGRPALSPNAWLVSGGCARPQKEAARKTGKIPALTMETAEAARRAPVAAPAPITAAPSAPLNGSHQPAPAPVVRDLPPPVRNEQTAVVAAAPAMPAGAIDALQAYQETMRQFIALQEQVMTRFLSGASMVQSAAAVAAPVHMAAPEPVAPPAVETIAAPVPPPTNGTVTGRPEIQALLLEQVSERTGYPPEMLGLDQDIEAELGIDSIKRVEILGALQERLPAAVVARVKDQMETLTRVKTLNGILDRLLDGATPTPAAAVPAPQPAATANGAALQRGDLQALLLEQVSERTGYPPDMLGLDQDIEAELGIDSIKRVEILGALQERLPAAIVARVKDQMETLTRVKTLNGLLDRLLDGADKTVAPPAAAAQQQPAAAPSSGPDRAELTALLVQQVSERTGYPPEMLGLDQDIEAELGIDSIKRVEVLGALQERLPASLGAQLRERMETLTRVKSLNGLIDAMLAAAGSGAPPREAPPAVPSAHKNGAGLHTVAATPRCRMQAFVEPLPTRAATTLAGLFLITADELSVAPAVASDLVSRGAIPALIDSATLGDAARLADRIGKLRAQHGPVTGVVHLAALARRAAPQNLAEWREACRIDVKGLFHILRLCADDLAAAAEQGQGWVFAASAQGGSYGRGTRSAGLPSAAGMLPLLKTARMEWPGLIVRSLDLPADLAPVEMAARVGAEFGLAGGHFEIGYPDGRRTAYKTVPAPHVSAARDALAPAGDWIVLVTGGARGITAEIACEIARPGMTLVIVGRTPMPAEEPADIAALADMAALRRVVIAKKTNGKPPTPVQVDRELQRILADREIRGNLARLREAGAVADYRSVDVRDEAAFGSLLDGLYAAHGRIDAVIHGAGVIEDKLIRDKTAESFDRVFDTKVDSAWILASRLRADSLRLLVFFSSVSGRYGNRGQGDYAAANDTLTRMAWHLRGQWPKTRVVSICWGPWDASGMVTDEVRRQFRERGVVAIEPQPGRRFFSEEILLGSLDDVEIIAGAGPWEREPALSPPPAGETSGGNGAIPTMRPRAPAMLLKVPELMADGTVVAVNSFDLSTHAFLADHRLDGIPVLPAAAALEWMAQFVQAAWPDLAVQSIGDVRVLKGIRLDNGNERRVRFTARASSHADGSALLVSVALSDPETERMNYKAVATLVPRMPEPLAQNVDDLAAGAPMDLRKAYGEYLFHGPSFQLLTDISKLDIQGVDAGAVASEPGRWLNGAWSKVNGGGHGAQWLFDPGLVDAAFQLALVWARVYQGKSALPGHLGAIARYGDGPLSGPLGLHLRITPRTNDYRVVFDAFAADSTGRIRLSMQNMECPSSPALNRLGGTA
jgi:acyl transferase domain-containing protein/NADP-dependent 3-hydroxy acid dehydrogenase YdfG